MLKELLPALSCLQATLNPLGLTFTFPASLSERVPHLSDLPHLTFHSHSGWQCTQFLQRQPFLMLLLCLETPSPTLHLPDDTSSPGLSGDSMSPGSFPGSAPQCGLGPLLWAAHTHSYTTTIRVCWQVTSRSPRKTADSLRAGLNPALVDHPNLALALTHNKHSNVC